MHRFAAIVMFFVAVVLGGCSAGTVEIEPVDARHVAVVEDAAARLGLTVEWGNGPKSIALEILDTDCGVDDRFADGQCGEAVAPQGAEIKCYGLWVLSVADETSIAHELGHALGLSHEEGTVMAPWWEVESEFTAAQLEQVADRSAWCWGT